MQPLHYSNCTVTDQIVGSVYKLQTTQNGANLFRKWYTEGKIQRC